MKRTVYIDCTFTYQSGLNTGIQRVVRSIVARHQLLADEFNIELVPVVCVRGEYYRVELEKVLEARPTIAAAGGAVKRQLESLKVKVAEAWVGKVGVSFLLSLLEKMMRTGFAVIKNIRLFQFSLSEKNNLIKFKSEDILLLADVFWTYDVPAALCRPKSVGVKVVSIIYDLIPIFYPEYVEDINRKKFSESLPRLTPVVDQFVCISKVVADDLSRFCKQNKLQSKKISSFCLGADFSKKKDNLTHDDVSAEMNRALSEDVKSWLMIGTIEPRKNHNFVLDAFEAIWSGGGEDRLVLIGRVGWMCDETIRRIELHPELNKKLFYFGGVSDQDLSFAYSKAKGLIFASFAEGFGLPIVEALSFKICVLCSDIPIFKEVAGEKASYFSLSRVSELVSLIEKTEFTEQSGFSWPTWDESARELAAFL